MMAVIALKVCSNCMNPVPKGCDGILYTGWARPVCRGENDGLLIFRDPDTGLMRLRVTVGHGDYSYFTVQKANES